MASSAGVAAYQAKFLQVRKPVLQPPAARKVHLQASQPLLARHADRRLAPSPQRSTRLSRTLAPSALANSLQGCIQRRSVSCNHSISAVRSVIDHQGRSLTACRAQDRATYTVEPPFSRLRGAHGRARYLQVAPRPRIVRGADVYVDMCSARRAKPRAAATPNGVEAPTTYIERDGGRTLPGITATPGHASGHAVRSRLPRSRETTCARVRCEVVRPCTSGRDCMQSSGGCHGNETIMRPQPGASPKCRCSRTNLLLQGSIAIGK